MASFSEVAVSLVEPDPERVLGRVVRDPVLADDHSVNAFVLAGWVVGRHGPTERVELVQDGRVVQATPVGAGRPNLAKRFPGVPWATASGWHLPVDPLAFETAIDAELRAVDGEQTPVPIARVQGRRQPLPAAGADLLQPLIVTALGRSGTTWLVRLLAEHPAIVAYRRYPYEVRPGLYWTHALRVLSGRPQFANPISHPSTFYEDRSAVGANPFHAQTFIDHRDLLAGARAAYIDDLARFCHASTERWYRCLAASQTQPDPVYFAEKHVPNEYPILLWETYPGAREIVLIRDFRDMACSVLAFNARRGFDDFGRQRVETDEAYIQQLRQDAETVLSHWRRRAGRAHLVRYEDLLTDPAASLRSVLPYLGLDAAPATIAGMIERAGRDTPELRQHQTSESPAASIGRWRRDLAPELRAVAAATFNDLLTAFGYDPDA